MDLLNLRNYYYITYSTGTENEVILKINNIYKSVLLYIIRKGVVLFDSISVKHQMQAHNHASSMTFRYHHVILDATGFYIKY